jgi:hypothetical protein
MSEHIYAYLGDDLTGAVEAADQLAIHADAIYRFVVDPTAVWKGTPPGYFEQTVEKWYGECLKHYHALRPQLDHLYFP